MTDIELRNENGKIVGYDRDSGEKIPVTFESASTDQLYTPSRNPDITVHQLSDGTWKADGPTGEIASGSTAATVVQAALDGLTSGRDYYEKVQVKDPFETETTIEVPSWTEFEFEKITQTDGADLAFIVRNKDTTDGNTNIIVRGGVIDGNKANNTTDCTLLDYTGVKTGHVIGATLRNSTYDAFIARQDSNGNRSRDITVRESVAENCGDDGFNPLDVMGITFTGCVARSQTNDGFHLSVDSEDVTCEGCFSHDNGTNNFAVYTEDATLSGCHSLNAGSMGYEIRDVAIDVTVTACHDRDPGSKSLRVVGGAESVDIDGFHGKTSTSSGIDGIEVLAGASDVTIRGGRLENYDHAIRPNGSSSNPITDLKIVGVVIHKPTVMGVKTTECPQFRAIGVSVDGPTSDFDAFNITNCDDALIADCVVENATRDDVNIDSGSSDIRLRDNDFNGSITDAGTRTRFNGTVELGSPPSDSNYSGSDAGDRILDTSTSPPTEYQVLQDGTTTTIQ